jgi:hypothetical protein
MNREGTTLAPHASAGEIAKILLSVQRKNFLRVLCVFAVKNRRPCVTFVIKCGVEIFPIPNEGP